MGKWSNGFLPMGPCLLTSDEIENPQNLNLELKVNGQIRQQSNTTQMIFDVNHILSFISHLMILEAGDVIITGTPHGVAAASGQYLKPGDSIECRIEKIGTLKNTIGPKPERFYTAFTKPQ
jgi:2-keto-4-pentenoate hydratase/2-oxohepta-3-ene-1,7-dioic acid hydratase in catechol pathway